MLNDAQTAHASPPPRPGWPEIALGVGVFVAIELIGFGAMLTVELEPMIAGLFIIALPGLAGLAGFSAAYARRLAPGLFGLRPTTIRWLVAGLGLGLLAFLVKAAFVLSLIAASAPHDTLPFGAAARGFGGFWPAVTATLLLGVLAPVGEELLFRGVVTNALLRYGPVVGVVGGAAPLALLHGMNIMMPAAVFAGLAAGELFRRCGSIWPPIALHIMFSLPTLPVMLLASASQ